MTPDPEGKGGVRRGAGTIESMGAPVSFLLVTLQNLLGQPVLDETGFLKFTADQFSLRGDQGNFRPPGSQVNGQDEFIRS
jgi:hypothetical protein